MLKSLIAKLNWKEIFRKVWDDIHPKLKSYVELTKNQYDDATLKAVEHLVERFLKGEENAINSEISLN